MTTISQRCFVKPSVDVSTSDDDFDVSLIYAFLPPMIQRSVPKVRSLRSSFCNYSSFRSHARASSIDSADGSRTPPPAYHEALAPLTAVLSDDDGVVVEGSSTPPTRVIAFSANEQSGIQWKYASQGLNLLTLSAQESTCATSDTALSRQLYINAATYLLRGLPDGLSEEELISLQAATPIILNQSSTAVGQLMLREDDQQDVHRTTEDPDPTVLHRIVSAAVFQFFILVSFLWPYIQVFVHKAYMYERNHHISERFASQTWLTANAIGKQTMSTANLVCTWNDGQVGETLESVITWWIQGVAGGICEGMGEGMEVLGVKPNRNTPRRTRGHASGGCT